MEYTEQQKKEYQAMRRKRKQDQEQLKSYLRYGRPISREKNQRITESGHTPSGKVFGGSSRNKWQLRKTVRKRIEYSAKKQTFVFDKKGVEQFTKDKNK